MTTVEKEQLTNTIELKAGIVRMKLENQEIEDTAETRETLALVEDAKQHGTSTTEAKYLLEDLVALIEG